MDLIELAGVIEIVLLEFPGEAKRMIDLYNKKEFLTVTSELKKIFKVGDLNEK